MDENNSDSKSILENIEAYSKTSIDLFKLKIVEKVADIISGIFSLTIVLLLIIMFIFIANISLALWLGELTGKLFYGFLILTGFYGFLIFLLMIFRQKWIKEPISNILIKKLLKD